MADLAAKLEAAVKNPDDWRPAMSEAIDQLERQYRRGIDQAVAEARGMVRYVKHPEPSGDGWTEWYKPRQPPEVGHYRIGCCDCGLVHELDFKVSEGAIRLRARRNERATAAKRRHRKNGS